MYPAPLAIRAAAVALAAVLTATLLLSMDVVAANQYDGALVAHRQQIDDSRLAARVACRNEG